MPRFFALLLPPLIATGLLPAAAAEVWQRCEGTVLEAGGTAERRRATARIGVSLAVRAGAAGADAALGLLQRRLAAVRLALRDLGVEELRVTAPTTTRRPADRDRPAEVTAGLQVRGWLPPARLQSLVRGVGSLPGVSLGGVTTEADPAEEAGVRRALLREAYDRARRQALEVAAVVGRPRITPLVVEVEGGERPPLPLRSLASAADAPFDPGELAPPTDRLSVRVRFCAR
ncbi:MAG: SIMPL domain-containing protein [Synechococcaceae cyanobacterium]|nr:SIMPL domain-containing protein [Synechococcaceae cyanobacterium]